MEIIITTSTPPPSKFPSFLASTSAPQSSSLYMLYVVFQFILAHLHSEISVTSM